MSKDLVLAICHLTADYHSGQWSRGYRLLCNAMRKANRMGEVNMLAPMTFKQQIIYRRLVKTYADKM